MTNETNPICLIIPPSAFLLDERVFMSLGILKIAAVLETKRIPVEMIDLSGIANYEDAMREHARHSQAKFFGITSTTPQLPATAKIAKAIRTTRPDAKIILGGPHMTLVNAALKKKNGAIAGNRAIKAMNVLKNNFDILVAGDGEEAILCALEENAPALIDADSIHSPLFLTNEKLTSLPYPARHLIDTNSYHYSIDGEKAFNLIAQLGCPFGCGFCGGRASPCLRIIRTRSTQSIIKEMVQLHKNYKINGFMFYDDELNVNKQMIELMKAIRETQNNLKTEWRLRGFVKSELFNEEQAAAMYEAGFRWILTGFESGSPRILKNIGKRANCEENTRCVEIAHKYGLKVKALMSIGHPGESQQTANETRQWLLEVKPDDFDISIITVYPGSSYYDDALPDICRSGIWIYQCRETGDRLYEIEIDYSKIADYYKGNPDGGYQAFVFTDYLASKEIVALRDELEQDVRRKLNIPFNPSSAAIRYEHSMGQTGLPEYILKKSRSNH